MGRKMGNIEHLMYWELYCRGVK